MKKIFTLALAAVMTAGMTTVAFAVPENYLQFVNKDGNGSVYVDKDSDGEFEASEIVDTGIKANTNMDVEVNDIRGGKEVAIPLYTNAGEHVRDKDEVKGFKVKTEWSVGKLDDKAAIELVKIENVGYAYAVTFTLPESAEVKVSDLAGKVSVYKNSSDLRDETLAGLSTLNFGAAYGYTEDILYNVQDNLSDAQVVVFKDALEGGKGLEGEYSMILGDIFEFEVDVTGQDKLNLKNNTKFDPEFAAMYDYANIDFVTFEMTPRFNKIGQVWIYADEDAFIYEVTADGAKAIKGLEWDPDYEAWTFKTRELTSYAISDVELDEKTVTEDKTDDSSKTDDGVKENPDTGR